jgi:MoaA/NifB/PqqE/SkfB family radical SAM enzyme
VCCKRGGQDDLSGETTAINGKFMFHGWQYLTPDDREKIIRGVEDGRAHGGPYHLELDWVDKCNAQCFFCNSEYLHNGKSVTWDRAAALLTEAVGSDLRSIRLSGGGEPTLHPQLPELLALLQRNQVVLDNLNTNGTQLTDRVLDALAQVRVGEVRVSLNYSNEADYARGMGLPPKFFHRAVEMVANLHAMRRANPLFGQIHVQFFVYKPTVHQLRECYVLGRKLGADLIIFRELVGIDPALQLGAEDVAPILEQMQTILREDRTEGRVLSQLHSCGIGEQVAGMKAALQAEANPPAALVAPAPALPGGGEDRYCYIGWYSMTITGNESVFPCCMLLSADDQPPLTTLQGKRIAEVWHGEDYTRLRKELRDFIMLQRRLPFFERRHRCIMPQCASHNGCLITNGMCDDPFYADADARAERIRQRPLMQAWRLANRAGRLLERKFGKPV